MNLKGSKEGGGGGDGRNVFILQDNARGMKFNDAPTPIIGGSIMGEIDIDAGRLVLSWLRTTEADRPSR